jgi:hypothetical protein
MGHDGEGGEEGQPVAHAAHTRTGGGGGEGYSGDGAAAGGRGGGAYTSVARETLSRRAMEYLTESSSTSTAALRAPIVASSAAAERTSAARKDVWSHKRSCAASHARRWPSTWGGLVQRKGGGVYF